MKEGDYVVCMNGRFEGAKGFVIEYNPDKYGQFCMVVDSVCERVNPDNWSKIGERYMKHPGYGEAQIKKL